MILQVLLSVIKGFSFFVTLPVGLSITTDKSVNSRTVLLTFHASPNEACCLESRTHLDASDGWILGLQEADTFFQIAPHQETSAPCLQFSDQTLISQPQLLPVVGCSHSWYDRLDVNRDKNQLMNMVIKSETSRSVNETAPTISKLDHTESLPTVDISEYLPGSHPCSAVYCSAQILQARPMFPL